MDNLANFFSSLQNAQKRYKKSLEVHYSKKIWNICHVLYREGLIQGFSISEKTSGKTLCLFLKYFENQPVLQSIRKISLQSRRIYTKKISDGSRQIRSSSSIDSPAHLRILSTSKGIISHREAEYFQVGGEILCEVSSMK